MKELRDAISAANDLLAEALDGAEALGLHGTYRLLDEALGAAETALASVVLE